MIRLIYILTIILIMGACSTINKIRGIQTYSLISVAYDSCSIRPNRIYRDTLKTNLNFDQATQAIEVDINESLSMGYTELDTKIYISVFDNVLNGVSHFCDQDKNILYILYARAN